MILLITERDDWLTGPIIFVNWQRRQREGECVELFHEQGTLEAQAVSPKPFNTVATKTPHRDVVTVFLLIN